MKYVLDTDEQASYTASQLDSLFPVPSARRTAIDIGRCIVPALDRIEHCLSFALGKYNRVGQEPVFSPLNTDQYAMFLYLLSHEAAHTAENLELADRLYALNKSLHGIDVYHGVELPRIFLLVHAVGTVLGRATYGDFLVVYQGVTVGGNIDLEYPKIGTGVALFAGSQVLGRSALGEGAMMAAGSTILDGEVPECHVCKGVAPNNTIHPTRRSVFDRYFVRRDD